MLKTLDLSLKVLSLFKGDKTVWSVNEIADHLGENNTKIYRIVETFTKNNYLNKNNHNKTYQLGTSILELGLNVNSMYEIKKIIHPYLLFITEKTQESSFLTILDDNEALTLDAVTGPSPINYAVSIGSKAPLYAGASYRSILAFLPDYLIKTILSEDIKKFTTNTKTDTKHILDDLDKIRKKGFAISEGELTEDIVAVAVPLYINGTIIGSITVSGPTYRITEQHIKSYVETLLEVKNNLENNNELSILFT